MLLNNDWEFYKVGEEAKKIQVDIPYDAMLREERSLQAKGGDKVGFFLGGDYVYTKKITFKKEDLDSIYYLRFEGVYRSPNIYINDQLAYHRDYGYTDFIFEATKFFKEGENIIKVEAFNADQPNSRWYSGAGIYRDVHLYKYDKVHLLPRSLKIKTLDYIKGIINVKGSFTDTVKALIEIKDSENKVVYTNEYEVKDLDIDLSIDEPHLWNVNSPYLYTLSIKYNNSVEERRFGIRVVELNKEKGFLINGIRTPLLGCCIHSDNGLLGAESYKDVEYRKAKIIKESGYNAIRSSHNPIVESFIDACDEIGLLILDEYVDCWFIHKTEFDYAQLVEKNYKEDLKDMVDKDYSHPSIIMYSTGNEVGETAYKKGIELTKTLTDTLHSYDDTRAVSCGINVFFNGISHTPFAIYSDKKIEKQKKEKEKEVKVKKSTNSSDIFNSIANFFGQNFMKYMSRMHLVDKYTKGAFANMDVAGYNYGIKRYKKDLRKYPNRFILGTETFCNDAGEFYELYLKYPRIIGDFVWSGLDYLGEAGFNSWANNLDFDYENDPSGWITDGGGRININGESLSEMDYTRVCFRLDPVKIGVISPHDLKGVAHQASWKFSRALPSYSFAGEENENCIVEVYTYADKVKLYLNDKLLKTFKNNGKYVYKYKMKYVPGILKAVAYDKNNKQIGEHILKSAGNETKLTLVSEKDTYKKDELVYIHARFTDSDGESKPLVNENIQVSEIENGTLLRFGSAARWNKDSYLDSKTKTYYGRVLAIVKPTKKGVMKVKIKSDSFEEEISIKIV